MRKIESVTKAYHSTRQKGLKKFENRTTMATIDTGEGAHVHGWGLYLQADEMQNRRDYYYGNFAEDLRDVSNDKIVTIGDNEYYMEYYAPGAEYSNENLDYNFSKDYNSTFIDKIITMLIRGYSIQHIIDYYTKKNEYHGFVKDLLEEITNLGYTIKDVDEESIHPPLDDGTHSEEASQYTVEIPDDMVFIDEDKTIPKWLSERYVHDFSFISNEDEYGQIKVFNCDDIMDGKYTEDVANKFLSGELLEHVKERRKKLIKELKQKVDWHIQHYATYTGRAFYNAITENNDYSDEKASLWLSENGIDGMTYEGGRDGGCFVIYNCDKLKIVGEY